MMMLLFIGLKAQLLPAVEGDDARALVACANLGTHVLLLFLYLKEISRPWWH